MKKIIALLVVLTSLSFSGDWAISVGVPSTISRGIFSIEKTFLNEKLSLNLHYGTPALYIEMGIGVIYHPFEYNGMYLFHSSNWIKGSGSYGADSGGGYIDRSNTHHWRLSWGIGYQHILLKHLGLYYEVTPIEFYVGGDGINWSYDAYRAKVSSNYIWHIGIGLLFPF
jgi:hypothetical protein